MAFNKLPQHQNNAGRHRIHKPFHVFFIRVSFRQNTIDDLRNTFPEKKGGWVFITL